MRYILYYSLLFINLSCNNIQDPYTREISLKNTEIIKGNILFSLNANHFSYDLKITDSYYILLDLENDTVMNAYKKGYYKSPVHSWTKTSGTSKKNLCSPIFMKNITNNPDKDIIQIIDKEIYEKKIQLFSDSVTTQEIPLKRGVSLETDYYRIGDELYSTTTQRKGISPYYFFHADSGYYWVDPSPSVFNYLQKQKRAYSCRLCINEQARTTVVAYRFINIIDFYDLRGNNKKTILVGDSIIPPIISEKIDVAKSMKHFIHISGTSKYIYCLYDGTSDFSANSIILILDWNGKQKAILQADRNLRTIAIDQSNQILLGISSRKDGGEDILEYKLFL